MRALASFPFVMAQATPTSTFLWQFAPFLPVIVIFYFIVIRPARIRQKKIQEFQSALKVGEKVITTSGIYGQIMKITDQSLQIQIAPNVRIEVARAAVGGYQGQPPVVPEPNN